MVGGSSDLVDPFHNVWFKVRKNNIHPQFNPDTLDYDVSVLKVWPQFRLGNRLNPVSLPAINTATAANTSVVVSGWGLQAENGQKISNKLQYTTVIVQDFAACNESYQGSLTPRMLCASAAGKDACQVRRASGSREGRYFSHFKINKLSYTHQFEPFLVFLHQIQPPKKNP